MSLPEEDIARIQGYYAGQLITEKHRAERAETRVRRLERALKKAVVAINGATVYTDTLREIYLLIEEAKGWRGWWIDVKKGRMVDGVLEDAEDGVEDGGGEGVPQGEGKLSGRHDCSASSDSHGGIGGDSDSEEAILLQSG